MSTLLRSMEYWFKSRCQHRGIRSLSSWRLPNGWECGQKNGRSLTKPDDAVRDLLYPSHE